VLQYFAAGDQKYVDFVRKGTRLDSEAVSGISINDDTSRRE
jgi:hypothetical protein